MAKVIMAGANLGSQVIQQCGGGGWVDQQNVSQLAFQTVKDKEFFLVFLSSSLHDTTRVARVNSLI